jgi:hypothetical protein
MLKHMCVHMASCTLTLACSHTYSSRAGQPQGSSTRVFTTMPPFQTSNLVLMQSLKSPE